MEFGVSLGLLILSLCSAVSHLTLKGLPARLGGTLAGCLANSPGQSKCKARALVSGCSKGALRPLAYR